MKKYMDIQDDIILGAMTSIQIMAVGYMAVQTASDYQEYK
jgi:hypothetical protein